MTISDGSKDANPPGGASEGAGEALAEIFSRTIDTFRDITLELPDVRSPRDAADVLLRDDRKMYVGIVLMVLAALALVVAN